jgi:phage shock protein A
MSVMKKVMTLLRGSVREIGETVVDANATRIYEQEILDAKQSITQAKDDLAGVMAKEMQSARQIEKLQAEIARYEGLAVEALDKSQEALAEEVAGKVGGLEQELQEQTRAHAAYAVQVTRLKDLIKQAEGRIREHEREIGVAKTTESVYRATRSISENIGQGGSKLMSARESLDRIKQRHEDLSDRMTAAEQLNNEFGQGALEKKLAAAGVGDEAKRQRDVMARIRARQAAQNDDPTAPSDTK